MVLPRRLARINKVATNRVTGLIAGWLPGFGFVEHVGRRSGRSYRIPVNMFRNPDGYVVALTYGQDSDWVKNVLAAGRCVLTNRGRRVVVTDPRIVHDETRRYIPAGFRQILAGTGIADFLYLTEESEESVQPGP